MGKNAVRGDHGQTSMDRMARLYTNLGVEAVARCWKEKEALAPLLGEIRSRSSTSLREGCRGRWAAGPWCSGTWPERS